MEPIVFHPGGSDNKTPESDKPVQSAEMPLAQSQQSSAEAVLTPKFQDEPPESQHNEILPSLAIPAEIKGKRLKRHTIKAVAKAFIITYVITVTAGILAAVLFAK